MFDVKKVKPPLKQAVVILRVRAKISKQTLDVCVCVCVCVQNQASERFGHFILIHFYTHTFPLFRSFAYAQDDIYYPFTPYFL